MNKTKIIEIRTYDAICDYCGRIIATECRNFNEVVKKAPSGTSFNGDGHYKCPICNNYKSKNTNF